MVLIGCVAVLAVLSPVEVLFFRLGVPVGSSRMQRLRRTVDNTWKDSSVFEDVALLDRRVAILESSLGPEAARVVVLRAPLVLTSDLETTLPPRISALLDLLPGADLPSLAARAPALLELDLQQIIMPRMCQLE